MSEPLLYGGIILGSALAGAGLVCLPLLLRRLWLTARRDTDERWRDRAPWPFRVIGRLQPELVVAIDRRLGDAARERTLRGLQESGLQYSITPAELVAAQLCCALAMLALLGVATFASDLLEPRMLPLAGVLVPLGWVYPRLWLRDASVRRKRAIERDFPFFLDVLVLSMKAGLAFPAAIEQSTARLPDGAIRQELFRVVREVRTGSNRSEALQRLARRVRLASVSNFVAVVAQAEESGGSLTKALQEQARQRRRERFQRAEKLANQAPVKLLFPLVAFLFPVTFMIIGYPLYEQLSSSGFLG